MRRLARLCSLLVIASACSTSAPTVVRETVDPSALAAAVASAMASERASQTQSPAPASSPTPSASPAEEPTAVSSTPAPVVQRPATPAPTPLTAATSAPSSGSGYINYHGLVVDGDTAIGIPDVCLVVGAFVCGSRSDANGVWAIALPAGHAWNVIFVSLIGGYESLSIWVDSLGQEEMLVPTVRMRRTAVGTATPATGYVRFHGRVVDANTGVGLAGICLVIGSLGCSADKPRSNSEGYWSVDLTSQPYWDITFQSPQVHYRTVTTRVYSLSRNDVLVPDIRMRPQ